MVVPVPVSSMVTLAHVLQVIMVLIVLPITVCHIHVVMVLASVKPPATVVIAPLATMVLLVNTIIASHHHVRMVVHVWLLAQGTPVIVAAIGMASTARFPLTAVPARRAYLVLHASH